ncbi:MAG: hypothetical protein EOP93_05705 [Lysobacteraceae bacterium]|nr:MAG: hypothetical protein EOP93_05705 [Xanthomonadaceae bacterium]
MRPDAAAVSSADVIALINSSVVLVAIVAVGFSLVGAVAVWRAGQHGAAGFFRMFERLQVLQLLTVMLVIASATVLALLRLIDSNGIIGILSGVAGYVLGGLNRAPAPPAKPPPPATKTAPEPK